ncbi:MAG: phytanoyl-CoA dioxygenase family protein [Pseudomonadota bacterium]|nr:phytanoyl-CoA dioxygenase family protein [Pseudomonadota bacterium]
MPKVLTKAELARSERDGCIFPVRIMDPDSAAKYRTSYEQVEDRKGRDVPDLLSVKPHVLFPWLFELGTTPNLLDAMEDLLGPDLLMTTCAIWPKKANDPSFVTWHQDSTYFGYDPMDVWGAWIAITDSHADNGCLKYLPGSHRNPEMAHEETFAANNMLSRGQRITDDFDASTAIDVELEPGECTIHHFRLAHSSEANLSDRRRIGILFVFCGPHVKPTNQLNSAILVRGNDKYGYWKRDPVPKRDLDPANLDYYEKFWRSYIDPENLSEATRKATIE